MYGVPLIGLREVHYSRATRARSYRTNRYTPAVAFIVNGGRSTWRWRDSDRGCLLWLLTRATTRVTLVGHHISDSWFYSTWELPNGVAVSIVISALVVFVEYLL